MKKVFRIFAVLIIFIVLAGVGAGSYLWYQLQPTDGHVETVPFKISKGDTGIGVASNLEEAGLIKSARFFSLYSRIRGTASLMKTGLYQLEGGQSAFDIHDILISGRQILYKVTIPEGWTSSQIAFHLEEEGITKADDFMAVVEGGNDLTEFGFAVESLEGFLYPDTYMFPLDYPASKVAETFVDNFFTNLSKAAPDYRELTSQMIYDKIVLASVVEREYRVDEEAPLISSVFHNRLDQGIKLQSCATVAYVITEVQGKPHPERLFFSDLEIESPFNTYKYQGLPPAPIANPGYVALEAAFNPVESDYLFFVVKDARAGTHRFSTTYNEHLTAKDLFIKTR